MEYPIKPMNVPFNDEYEVIVLGGGPAGCAAAASAAREGAKTLLIESSGMLGGMATKGLVPAWTPYTDRERIIYGGIAKDVMLKTKRQMSVVPEDSYDWVPIDYEYLKTVYDELVTGAGADVLFHTMLCGAETDGGRNVNTILVAGKSGICAYRARVYIDCTGDADLYAFAGGEYRFGDDETHEVQPATYCFIISGVNDAEYDKYREIYGHDPISGGNPDAIIHRVVAEGKFDIPDTHCCSAFIAPHTMGFNAGHIWEVDYTNPRCVSKAILEGRAMARRYYEALKYYLPNAFADAYLVETAPTLGCRESRRIIGDYVFTLEDYLARRTFPDEIARNNYYVDIHRTAQENNNDHPDQYFEHYKRGESHGVPYRILCPKQFDNMLVAGRTVSSDRITQGSLRIMPLCLCEGEAAGIAAYLALQKEEINIHTIDTDSLRSRLIGYGAYLPKV